jgi:hypothetical protein
MNLLLRLCIVLLLQLPQLAPAGVLLGFGGIGIFFVTETKQN